MPILPNSRREAFAQGLAKGETQDEAYVKAGYKPSRAAASRLSTNVNIRERVSELQEKSARRAEVTLTSLLDELDEARVGAIAAKQYGAATQASMGKAKLTGHVVDRKHLTGRIGTYDLSKVSDRELDALEAILGPLADDGGDSSGEGQTQH